MIRMAPSPMLLDYLLVASMLPTEERELYTALTGEDYHHEFVAHGLFGAGQGGRIASWYFDIDGETPPIALGGYIRARPGVWQSFFMAREEAWAPGVGRELTELVAGCVQWMFQNTDAHRLETVTLVTRTRARAWYERIGLHYEATMCKYCANGEDAVLYVATKA